MGDRKKVTQAVIRSLLKNLVVSGLVVGASVFLMQMNRLLGVLVLGLYSCIMVVRACGQERPLGWFTSLAPGVISLACFLLSLFLFPTGVVGDETPIGLVAGLLPGFLMARTHDVFQKNGRVYARRTYGYLAIWAVCYMGMQASALLGMSRVTYFAMFLHGFSSGMMIALSLLLLKKYLAASRGKPGSGLQNGIRSAATTALLFMVLGLALYASTANAWARIVQSAQEAADIVLQNGDIPGLSKLPFRNNYRRMIDANIAEMRRNGIQVLDIGAVVMQDTPDKLAWHVSFDVALFALPDETTADVAMKVMMQQLRRNSSSLHFFRGVGKVAVQSSVDSATVGFLQTGPWLVGVSCFEQRRGSSSAFRERLVFRIMQLADGRLRGLRLAGMSQPATSFRGSGRQSTGRFSSGTGDYSDAGNRRRGNSSWESSGGGSSSDSFSSKLQHIADRFDSWQLSREAVTVGLVAALIQLLLGMGMNVAMAAAQAAATEAAQAADKVSMDIAADDSQAASRPPLIDPETGEPLEVQDGRYQGGKLGQVWYDGKWMDYDDAKSAIDSTRRELEEERLRRQQEIGRFWNEVENGKEARRRQHEEELRAQGYQWDEERQAWIAGSSPSDLRLDEFHRRRDWIYEHMDSLTARQQDVAQRILDRIEANGLGYPDNLSDRDLDDLRRLSRAINFLNTGESEMEGAQAQRDAANARLGEQLSQAAAGMGELAANRIDPSGGIVSDAVFGAAQNWDKGLSGAVKEGAANAAAGWVHGRIGGKDPGNVALNALSGGATNAAKTGLMGGSQEDIQRSAGTGALFGGIGALGHHMQQYHVQDDLPSLQAGDDPTLAAGSHGIGSESHSNLGTTKSPASENDLPSLQADDDPTLAAGSRGISSETHADLGPARSPAPENDLPPTRAGDEDAVTAVAHAGGSEIHAGSRPEQSPATEHDLPSSQAGDDPTLAGGSRGGGTGDHTPARETDDSSMRAEAADDKTATPKEGDHHAEGISSPEEEYRKKYYEIWVLRNHGKAMRITNLANSVDYQPRHNEVVILRNRYSGKITPQQHGAGLSREIIQRLIKTQGEELPKPELPSDISTESQTHVLDGDPDALRQGVQGDFANIFEGCDYTPKPQQGK